VQIGAAVIERCLEEPQRVTADGRDVQRLDHRPAPPLRPWPVSFSVAELRSDGGTALTLRAKRFCFLLAIMFAFDSATSLTCLAESFPTRSYGPPSHGGALEFIAAGEVERV
jgi:hypothetical protein